MLPNEIYLNILSYCCETAQLHLVSKTFDSLCDIAFKYNNDFGIEECCCKNHVEAAKKLLKNPNIDISYNNNYCLRLAIWSRNLEIIKLLSLDERVNFNVISFITLSDLSTNSQSQKFIDIMKIILTHPTFDPSNYNNYAIRWFVFQGDLELTKRFLEDPRVDPSDMNNEAIKYAFDQNIDIFELLMKHPKVNPNNLSYFELIN